MIEKIGRKRYRIFAFDVESHNDAESIAMNKTSIWLFSFIDETSKVDDPNCYGYSMDDFISRITALTRTKREDGKRLPNNIKIYIWNASFEWSFILPCLLEKGYKFKEKIGKGDEKSFNSITTKSCSSVWCANIKPTKAGGMVVLCDLCKIFPGSLREVAKSFGLPTQKGEIDYTLNRLHGHIVTDQEREYCFKDTKIVMDILTIMDQKGDKEFFKSMSAASYSARKLVRMAFPHAYKPLKAYRKYYPELGKEENEFDRKALAGGITYAPNRWQFKDIKQTIGHVDAHQMHPTQPYKFPMPFGKGEYFKGRPPIFRISICHIKVSYSGVILHSVIKLIGQDFGTDIELWVYDFEIPVMRKCYIDLAIEYIDGYAYHARFCPWRMYYKNNYDLRLKAKAEGDAFGTMYYKTLNNAGGYGKFVERPHDTIFENYINEKGYTDSKELPKDDIKENATLSYIPFGGAVPARSRCALILNALFIDPTGKKIVYFDTDSIFYIRDKETDERASHLNYNDELGGWGREKDITRATFAAPKRYKIMERQKDGSDKLVLHMAGFNFITCDEDKIYRLDPDESGKLIPVTYEMDIDEGAFMVQGTQKARGGTLIIYKRKDVSVQKKYLANYNANVNN